MDIANLFVIIRKEFEDSLRTRWLQAMALIYALLALAISYLGLISRGEIGFQNLEFTLASLVNLAIYLIPLMALLLGHAAIVGEREGGSLAVLLTITASRREVLLGKFLGLSLSLAAASLGGFGSAGLIIALRTGFTNWWDYLVFILLATFLSICFLSIGLLISAYVKRQSMALGISILIWFFLVVIFDLLLLGLLIYTSDSSNSGWLTILMLINPTDVFRMFNMLRLDTLKETMGMASLISPVLRNPLLLLGILFSWVIIPLAAADTIFRRIEI